MNDLESIQQVDLFARLDTRHLKAILKACTSRVFQKDEMLVEQDNPGIGMFIIMEGRVLVEKTLKDGSRIRIAENGPGTVIGEMSVLDGSLRTASVRALETTRCLALAAWSFKSLMEVHPEVALGVLPVVVQRFRQTNDQFMALSAAAATKSGPEPVPPAKA